MNDVAIVARAELAEALRTRLLVVMMFLFVGAGALGAWGFSEVVDGIETRAAAAMGAPATQQRPGGTLRRMRDSRSYHDFLRTFLRDDEKAAYYAAQPPIVVFFGWASFVFTPWLLLFTAADTIAAEVASRSIRFAALRTSRLSYALGKAFGQVIILAGVTALSAIAFYGVAWARMAGFEHGATALGLLSYWPRVALYALPFLAWALLASMVSSSANQARVVSLGGAVVLSIAAGVSSSHALRGDNVWANSALDLLGYITPFGHREGLSYPHGGALAVDLATCLALAVVYFAAGYAALRRRDI